MMRRSLLGLVIGVAGMAFMSSPVLASMSGEELLRKLLAVDAVQYEFMQFGPRGEQVSGTVKIARPGRIRFDYDPPSPLTVVADGRSLGVNNRKLGTWTLYPLDKTPFGVLLNDQLAPDVLGSIKTETAQDVTTVILTDAGTFGGGNVRILFDSRSGDLRQWTVIDGAGKETSVIVDNASKPAAFDSNTFRIPYSDIRKQ